MGLSALADADTAIRAVAVLSAIGQFLVGAQLFAEWRLFAAGGWFDWNVIRRGYRRSGRLGAIVAAVPFGPAVAVAVASLKCTAACGLLAAAVLDASLLVPLAVLVAANSALAVRMPFGFTSADGLGNVVALSLLISAAVGSPSAARTCLVFLAALAMLAYDTAGLSKARHRGWYDGSFIRAILSTESLGHARVARHLRGSAVASTALGCLVVLAECLLPLLLIAPVEIAAGALVVAVVFHVAAALIMGLNTFLWAFAPTFPAVLFLSLTLHS